MICLLLFQLRLQPQRENGQSFGEYSAKCWILSLKSWNPEVWRNLASVKPEPKFWKRASVHVIERQKFGFDSGSGQFIRLHLLSTTYVQRLWKSLSALNPGSLVKPKCLVNRVVRLPADMLVGSFYCCRVCTDWETVGWIILENTFRLTGHSSCQLLIEASYSSYKRHRNINFGNYIYV